MYGGAQGIGVDGRAGTRARLTFHGRAGSLFGIHVVNVFLTLATLGIYYFWAKARVRAHLYGQTEFDGDRFAFHGTGLEMLLGFVKALVIFGIPFAFLRWGPALLVLEGLPALAMSFAAYWLVTIFIPIARIGARRYRLGRTSWRGIRFSFRGSTWEYVRLFVTGSALTGLTLGLYYPVFAVRSHAFMTRNSWVGSARFDFDGRGRDLLVAYLYAVLLTLPTLGLAWFWFSAARRRYFWNHTSIRGARFHCTITGGRLLRLRLANVLILALTLGLGWPLATVRNARFICRHLALDGDLDAASIRQDSREATATGEGLLGFLEADLNLG